jgi:AcrR family transcriptional regulator
VEASSKRAHTKEHNRRLILEAARGVFARQGYRTATVRDIIGATSLASGTFYNYFKSKEEVFAALRDDLAEEIRPLLRVERERAKTAEEFIAGTFRAFLSHAAVHSSTLVAIKAHDDDISPARTAVMGNDDLRRDIEAAIARGLFADLDAELLAAAIIGVAFVVADVMRQRSAGDVHRATRFCADLVLRGLPSPPGTAR